MLINLRSLWLSVPVIIDYNSYNTAGPVHANKQTVLVPTH